MSTAFDLLEHVRSGDLLLREELERLAGYAKQEKRSRKSLDALADALLG